ncbi:iron-siderophore ABC transporter substrate-binding protein [Ancylobacter dichloromethanicus]|uniref:ABC transporter substrate-binding protein n=1 Tax=Ancylobacter dichloromethanicus TaxID=518825 RepID=A0A9W6N151_9HYPH|nr:iron-siderophore ABC transporter substrate-binding protein [Ancylobacter dichloromethanicus]MBS7552124.1 iron-siderophore ABC transporter substrate-binding protein [Ancylobacter dichloromethanicus]GLK73856.1 ABC transporter substrate-binding protein [Ancylobacter dichloromethanicus]
MTPLSRRALLRGGLAAGVLSLPLAGPAPAGTALRPPFRVVAMDFGLAETLIEIGLPPVALPDPGGWADWVVEPALPPGIVNLGTDREPNLELLAALKPDLIVTTPYLAAIRPLLEGFAPTREFPVYAPPGGHPYALSEAATRSLGAAVGRTDEAEALIARAQAAMAQAGAGFVRAGIADRPVLAVNFLDTRHVRVYGSGSLFGDVMERTGLVNGWTRPSNYWGFSTVGIEELAQSPASSLLYLEPISVDTLDRLAASPLWNSLAFVKAGRVLRLPPVLMFGMLPSAMRFAGQLSRVLDRRPSDG